MFLPANPAKRAALLTAGGLLLALGLSLLLFRPGGDDALRGMGLSFLLAEEKKWRAELWLEGDHINEQELWQIQETLALRAGISTNAFKSLSRRAVNAKDAAYRVEGHLLAGNTAWAADMAGRLAAWYNDKEPTEQARWHHRRADALWRGGLEDPAAELRAALEKLPPRGSDDTRRELLADLASWHWAKANFRPEDPAAELDKALAALDELQSAAAPKAGPAWHTALRRLQGRCLLRRACLDTERDQSKLHEAAAAFEQALATASSETRIEVRAAILHDLALCHLERGEPATAAQRFNEVLETLSRLAPARAGQRIDVRALERRLTARLNAQAFLSLARARQAATETNPEPRATLLAEAKEIAATVHGMTLPDDDGPAWIVAQTALLLTRLAAADTTGAATARETALQHYPHTQAGEPGVPSLAEIKALR